MLKLSLGFLAGAIIAAVLGFSGLVGAAADIANALFIIFLLFFVISAISRTVQGKQV
ncbi:MAG: DUF1328 domain-containing protein [Acidimicrobiales bacterium]|nr:DUF1328 domain-containing protein [Hyphomonadaceae bacterium]RZV44511.1 MAG: DUF1328 domain-containing protein [Acidimicrobiales bacterium]